MSHIYYSAQTNGFYNSEINGSGIPLDAIEITEQHHRDLLQGQSSGQSIQPDGNGSPILVVPSFDQMKVNAIGELNSNFKQCHIECRGYYQCGEERETWDQQKREAQAYTADSQAVTPFMDAFVAANPNMTKSQLATTIIANATAMSEAAGDLGGQLSAKRAAIIAALDETELAAVDMTFVMPTINLEDK